MVLHQTLTVYCLLKTQCEPGQYEFEFANRFILKHTLLELAHNRLKKRNHMSYVLCDFEENMSNVHVACHSSQFSPLKVKY